MKHKNVHHVLKLSKSGKSPSVDNIPVELPVYKNYTVLNELPPIFII
jgi:hypothetical protein